MPSVPGQALLFSATSSMLFRMSQECFKAAFARSILYAGAYCSYEAPIIQGLQWRDEGIQKDHAPLRRIPTGQMIA